MAYNFTTKSGGLLEAGLGLFFSGARRGGDDALEDVDELDEDRLRTETQPSFHETDVIIGSVFVPSVTIGGHGPFSRALTHGHSKSVWIAVDALVIKRNGGLMALMLSLHWSTGMLSMCGTFRYIPLSSRSFSY